MKWLKGLLGRGIRIGYSTGKPFDPTDQVRTDAIQDIIKSDAKKRGKNGDTRNSK